MGGAEHAAELVLEHTEGPAAVIGIIVGAVLAVPQQGASVPVRGPLGTVNSVPVWHNAFTHSVHLDQVVKAGIVGGLFVAAFVAVVVWLVIQAFKSLKPKPSVTQSPPRK